MKTLLLFALALTATGCCPKPDPSTPGNVQVTCLPPDGGVDDDEAYEADKSEEALGGLSPCSKACKSLAAQKCRESKKLKGSKTCIQNCHDIGPISSYDPLCVANATTVDAIRKCPKATCTL